MKKAGKAFFVACSFAVCLCIGLLLSSSVPAAAQTIIEEWASVKVPPPPALKEVTVDPASTALLLLDLLNQSCNAERRPRCIDSIPKVQKLAERARAAKMLVIYSLFAGSVLGDTVRDLAPKGGEPVVNSGADKFVNTDLEKILKDRNIKTVIVTGTAAHGAVLYTASGAALRSFKVIVPVDGMSAELLYAEQYTAWDLANAPTVSPHVTLSKTDMIKF